MQTLKIIPYKYSAKRKVVIETPQKSRNFSYYLSNIKLKQDYINLKFIYTMILDSQMGDDYRSKLKL